MLQDRLEALLLVSFENDILLALTNDLHEGCIIIFNRLKTVCVLYDLFSSNIHKITITRSGFFHPKMQPKRWRLGLRPCRPYWRRLIVALSPIFMET